MWECEIDTLRAAVETAGRRVRQLAADGFDTFVKQDRSPVTTADLEVNGLLHEMLMESFPSDGWLSEETPDDLTRLQKKRVWIVDPIDGTKYFMKGVPQYTISAALLEDGLPAVAVVYNPATRELFSAVRGKGASLNGASIVVTRKMGARPVVLVNPSAFARAKFASLEAMADCRPMGSIAYTLALVAAGRADATFNSDRLNEWDIAAGVLLIQEAGGTVVDRHDRSLTFNRPVTSVHGVIGSASVAREQMRNFVEAFHRA
jgi:myo-inositol-1(or 4)-monophosphatase